VVDARTNADGLVDYVISGLAGESMVVNVASDDDSIDTVIEILDLDENVLATIDDALSLARWKNWSTPLRVMNWSSSVFGTSFAGEGDFVMTVDMQ
jgi:hypothetical protein